MLLIDNRSVPALGIHRLSVKSGEMTRIKIRIHGEKKNVCMLGGFFPVLVDFEPMGCRHVWYLQVTIGCGRE